jgi:E3 ubiquitin-protein ligase ZNF598
MSSQTQTTTQTQNRPKQNRRGGKPNHRAPANPKPKAKDSTAPTSGPPEDTGTAATVNETTAVSGASAEDGVEDADVCWICAEPVKFYSVSTCNHRTCHVCAVRLRALYKKQDCTFCKVHTLCAKLREPS